MHIAFYFLISTLPVFILSNQDGQGSFTYQTKAHCLDPNFLVSGPYPAAWESFLKATC